MAELTDAVNFFYHNAGYFVRPGETEHDGRLRGAIDLAEAEGWARGCDLAVYRWESDWDGDHSYTEQDEFDGYEVTTCESLTLFVDGELEECLGCIDDATDDYRRVCEAEMASQYLYRVRLAEQVEAMRLANLAAEVDAWLSLGVPA